jgi:hypothetical protein
VILTSPEPTNGAADQNALPAKGSHADKEWKPKPEAWARNSPEVALPREQRDLAGAAFLKAVPAT